MMLAYFTKLLAKIIIFFVSLLLIISIFFYYKQEVIIQYLLKELSKKSIYSLLTGKISYAPLSSFPSISFIMNDVKLQHKKSKSNFLEVDKVCIQFNILQLLNKRYMPTHIVMEQGVIKIVPVKPAISSKRVSSKMASKEDTFQKWITGLASVDLKNMQVIYHHTQASSKQLIHLYIHTGKLLSRKYIAGKWTLSMIGDIVMNKMQWGGKSYEAHFPAHIRSTIVYDIPLHTIALHKTIVRYNKNSFFIHGQASLYSPHQFDFLLQGNKVMLATLLANIPSLQPYKIAGHVTGSVRIYRTLSKKTTALKVAYRIHQGKFTLPKYPVYPVHIAHCSGQSYIDDVQKFTTAKVNIDSIQAFFLDNSILGSGMIQGWPNIAWQGNLQSNIALSSLSLLFPNVLDSTVHGCAKVKLQYNSPITWTNLRNRKPDRCHIQLMNGKMSIHNNIQPVKNVNGKFILQDDTLKIENITGKIGNNILNIHGWCAQPMKFFHQQGLWPHGYLSILIPKLDISALYKEHSKKMDATNTQPSRFINFRLPMQWKLDWAIDTLLYQHIQGRQLHSLVTITPDKISMDNFHGILANGQIAGQASLRHCDHRMYINLCTRIEHMAIDSLLYIFKNFGQSMLTSQYVSGTLNSYAAFSMYATPKQGMLWKTLSGDINFEIMHATVSNAQLIKNIQNFSRYFFNVKSCKQLQFALLKNRIQISNQTITIPSMEIGTNLCTLRLSGKHAFDQSYIYNLMIPLQPVQGMNVLLKFQGKGKNYKISYDTKTLTKRWKAYFKKNKKDIKDIFKGNYRKQQQPVQLSDKNFSFEE